MNSMVDRKKVMENQKMFFCASLGFLQVRFFCMMFWSSPFIAMVMKIPAMKVLKKFLSERQLHPRPTNMGGANNVYNFQVQSKYLLNMAYLRAKNITVGYSLPDALTDNFGVTKFRVYFSGENLFEFDKLDVPLDPEVDFYSRDFDFGRAYPFSRSVSFGVQVSI